MQSKYSHFTEYLKEKLESSKSTNVEIRFLKDGRCQAHRLRDFDWGKWTTEVTNFSQSYMKDPTCCSDQSTVNEAIEYMNQQIHSQL